MGLSRTVNGVSRNIRRFQSKIAKFSHPPFYLRPRWRSSLWNWAPALGSKTTMMGLLGRERSLTISLAVWIQSTNVTDRQKDGQTDTGRQQRPRLRIASRCKNTEGEWRLLSRQTTYYMWRSHVCQSCLLMISTSDCIDVKQFISSTCIMRFNVVVIVCISIVPVSKWPSRRTLLVHCCHFSA